MTAYMYSDPRCAFVRVPKTGSTSIMNAFFGKPTARADCPLPSKEFWNYEKSFAFVRHPLDRFISVMSMFLQRGANIYGEFDVPKGWSTPTTNQILDLVNDNKFKLSKVNYLETLKIHALPQSHDYHSLSTVDRIFKYEGMSTVWDELAIYLNIDAPNMVRLNTSYYAVQLTDAEIDTVQDFYKKDYRAFKYKKMK